MMTLPKTLVQFNQLKDAEDYFQFFGLAYDPKVVNINRLHILRKYSQLVQEEDTSQFDEQMIASYRRAMQIAYD